MRRVATLIGAGLLAGCAGRPAPAPEPGPAPPAASPPAIAAREVPQSPQPDWPDRPLTPGDWSYRSEAGGSEARFAGFGLRCDSGRRQIVLFREGATGALRVRTTYGERSFSPGQGLAAGDPLLDEMAFSRGRFAVEADGGETLIVPAWAEPARVAEDCRG